MTDFIATVAISAIFCLACGFGFLKIFPFPVYPKTRILLHANLLCTGVMLGLNEQIGLTLFFILLLASTLSFTMTILMARIFYYHWIPVFLLPSLVVSAVLLNFSSQPIDFHFDPNLTSAFLGLVMAGLGCLVSPIFISLLLLGLIVSFGYFELFLLIMNSASLAQDSMLSLLLSAFAFALISSVLLFPSKKSVLWAFFGGALWSWLYLTQPDLGPLGLLLNFNIVCVVSSYAGRIFMAYGSPWSWSFRPEDKLYEHKMTTTRFRLNETKICLPFKGSWLVSQGFEGKWTHQGLWKYALDFVVADASGKTFSQLGGDLHDYYAYGQEVLAPCSGYIVAVRSTLPDNPIGTVNNLEKFGNYVIIRNFFGAYIVVAHLQQNSLTCNLYQYVDAGTPIGLCGNSGYSPEPHIHIHVQLDAVLGSATIPFHLINCLSQDHFYFNHKPKCGEMLHSPKMNEALSNRFNFKLLEKFSIARTDVTNEPVVQISNRLDPNGKGHYFTDGSAKLFHCRDKETFYFYEYEGPPRGPLFDLMVTLPRAPLIYGSHCSYDDLIPFPKDRKDFWSTIKMLCFLFLPTPTPQYTINCDILEVSGKVYIKNNQVETLCLLDPITGFAEFKVGERTYEIS